MLGHKRNDATYVSLFHVPFPKLAGFVLFTRPFTSKLLKDSVLPGDNSMAKGMWPKSNVTVAPFAPNPAQAKKPL